jgi:hypothetical protein
MAATEDEPPAALAIDVRIGRARRDRDDLARDVTPAWGI